ncbi:MAG: C13 family peptidase [Steroidobacteraceae bacterium]
MLSSKWMLAALMLGFGTAHAELNVLIVEGLGGEAQYTQQFDTEVKAIRAASTTLASADHIHVLSGAAATSANISALLKQFAGSMSKEDRLILYLVGHGSYDGYEYKFNIPGADLSGTELARLLDAIKSNNQLIVASGSASGALLEVLKKDSRLVMTATRGGNERNATHFGGFFAEALSDASADTDKNGRISAQEAFDIAARKVKDYFEGESKLSTEHAQLVGARADVFALAQLSGAAVPVANAANAGLPSQREQLNGRLEDLRLRKDSLGEDEYLKQLEPLLLQIAELDAQLNTEGGKEAKP